MENIQFTFWAVYILILEIFLPQAVADDWQYSGEVSIFELILKNDKVPNQTIAESF